MDSLVLPLLVNVLINTFSRSTWMASDHFVHFMLVKKYHLRESKVLCGIWKTTIWYRAITLSLELYWYFTFCVEMNGFKWTHERITPSQSVGQNFVYVFHIDHVILNLVCLYFFVVYVKTLIFLCFLSKIITWVFQLKFYFWEACEKKK